VKGVALGSAVVAAFASTYIIGKDEYVIYTLSGIESDMKNLVAESKDTMYHTDVLLLQESFNVWLRKMIQRTQPTFYGKIGCVIGSSGVIASYFMNNTPCFYGGLLGLTASGCYLVWNSITLSNTNYLSKEDNCYQKVVDNITKLHQSLHAAYLYPDLFQPSAPSMNP
jgi:hypothetical protein